MLDHGVLLTIAYEGGAFSGWAPQPGVRTVADAVRGALVTLDPRAEGPRGTSRTDAGVHAAGQMAAFDTSLLIPPRGWVLALNRELPDDVAIRSARPITVGYNPRFASRRKRYRYALLLDRVRDPLVRSRTWRVGYELDLEAMNRESRLVVGTHDFAAFRSAGDQRAETTRTVFALAVSRLDERRVDLIFDGNAFLYNMVRILVGTLVDVGRGHLPEGSIQKALVTKDRSHAGQTAPAHGLVLERIDLDLPTDAGAAWPP